MAVCLQVTGAVNTETYISTLAAAAHPDRFKNRLALIRAINHNRKVNTHRICRYGNGINAKRNRAAHRIMLHMALALRYSTLQLLVAAAHA